MARVPVLVLFILVAFHVRVVRPLLLAFPGVLAVVAPILGGPQTAFAVWTVASQVSVLTQSQVLWPHRFVAAPTGTGFVQRLWICLGNQCSFLPVLFQLAGCAHEPLIFEFGGSFLYITPLADSRWLILPVCVVIFLLLPVTCLAFLSPTTSSFLKVESVPREELRASAAFGWMMCSVNVSTTLSALLAVFEFATRLDFLTCWALPALVSSHVESLGIVEYFLKRGLAGVSQQNQVLVAKVMGRRVRIQHLLATLEKAAVPSDRRDFQETYEMWRSHPC